MEKFEIDIVVDDEELEHIALEYKNICITMENMMSSYISIMSDVCESSIQSGNVHNNLVSYYNTVRKLSGQIKNIGTCLEKNVNNYIAKIDETDGKLYD